MVLFFKKEQNFLRPPVGILPTMPSDFFLSELSTDALALFGQTDIYSTHAWYAATSAHACPAGAAALFVTISRSGKTDAIFPMLKGPGKSLSSLSTPYTGLWQPLFAPGLSHTELEQIAAAFASYCRQYPVTRLDALDAESAFWPLMEAAARAAGLRPLRFAHFGNWHEILLPGTSWETYLACRPGALREAVRRKTARFFKRDNARFEIVGTHEGLQSGLAAYQEVYAASWKKPEPYPLFIPAFTEEAASEGTLRLSLLHEGNRAIAAQLWTVHHGTATVMKLAHRKDTDGISPGTILTGLTIRHLRQDDTVSVLDFGRGDDPYKSLWATKRHRRTGLLLVNSLSRQGAVTVLRHSAGRARYRLRDILSRI